MILSNRTTDDFDGRLHESASQHREKRSVDPQASVSSNDQRIESKSLVSCFAVRYAIQ